MTRITALRMFARWWIDISIVLIAIGAFGIALNDGIERMAAAVNPFNVLNILAIVGVFIPAFVASKWATSLENAAPLGDDEAQRLVNAYGEVLMHRRGIERISPDALPASKAKMKEAILYAARRADVGPERETLGAGYVMLADFQTTVAPSETQLGEMAALVAEWNAFNERYPTKAGE